MSVGVAQRNYTIKEAAALTGLPASTLRYYESIGVISPVERGASSKHRMFTEADLDQLMWVACLAATGMSVNDMRSYMANGRIGDAAATDQVALLEAQQVRLDLEAQLLEARRRYVQLKIDYWHAVADGDDERAHALSGAARRVADELRRFKRS